MAEYHTIRLHGPWQADFFSSPSKQQQRIKLPLVNQVWVKPEFAGAIELTRHFNWPHEDAAAVYLQVDSDIRWTVWVNDHSIVPIDEANKTSLVGLLNPRNQLRLRAEIAAGAQSNIREISLKIS